METLATAGRGFRRWLVRYPRAVPVAIFLLTSAVTTLSVYAIERVESQRVRAQLGQRAQSISSSLERLANSNAAYLRAGAALFATMDALPPAQFRRFVSELRFDASFRGSDGIGWAPRVNRQDVPAYEAASAVIWPDRGRLRPALAPDQPYAVPVTLLEPDTGRNRRALGYDMFSEGVRRAAMLEALRTARPTASGKVVLEQEGTDRAPGFLVYMPVFESAGASRRLKGFIFSPFNAQDFLSSALNQEGAGDVGIRLYDRSVSSKRLMASVNLDQPGDYIATQQVMIANHPWVLQVHSADTRTLSDLSLVTLLFGMLVASLLMVVARLVTQQAKEDQEALAWFEEQNSIRNSLTRELNHRVKNSLANVLSIVALTKRRATNVESFAETLNGRIRALSATHDLLTQSEWGATPIRSVIEAELAPYAKAGEHVLHMEGPDVELAPNDALSLGLAVHELATNAAKYGALSRVGGNVRITWRRLSDRLASVSWAEAGGPPVAEEREKGFGTDLIQKVVAHELGNPVELIFDPAGVRCELTIPVRERSEFAIRARR